MQRREHVYQSYCPVPPRISAKLGTAASLYGVASSGERVRGLPLFPEV